MTPEKYKKLMHEKLIQSDLVAQYIYDKKYNLNGNYGTGMAKLMGMEQQKYNNNWSNYSQNVSSSRGIGLNGLWKEHLYGQPKGNKKPEDWL